MVNSQAKFTIANRMGQYNKRHKENGNFMFLRAIKAITQDLSMRDRRLSNLGLLAASIVILTACSVGSPEQKLNLNPTDRQTTSQQGATDALKPSPNEALAGTTWRFVQIMPMDDRVDVPNDRSLYTLEFNADGSMRVRADCNFGKGSWASAPAGQLLFGQIAATRALCPPGSLHDRYMAQFPWVRSYVIKEGRLFLATMADGSIIEFEPMLGK
jgi:heat shock protein HslJ